MHVWISLSAAPVPALSTADQVTGPTFTWLTQLPVIDNTPAFVHCCSHNIDIECTIMKQVILKNTLDIEIFLFLSIKKKSILPQTIPPVLSF